MSLRDDLPNELTETGELNALEPVLDAVDTPTEVAETDADGTCTVFRPSFGGDTALSQIVDPGSRRRSG